MPKITSDDIEVAEKQPKRTQWRGPRNLPKPDAKKRHRREQRQARKRNRGE